MTKSARFAIPAETLRNLSIAFPDDGIKLTAWLTDPDRKLKPTAIVLFDRDERDFINLRIKQFVELRKLLQQQRQ